MGAYLIFSQFAPSSKLSTLEQRSAAVHERRMAACPNIKHLFKYVLASGFDTVDGVDGGDFEEVSRYASIIREYGEATTHVVPATSWKEFKAGLGSISG